MQLNFVNEVKISTVLAGRGNSDTRLLHFKETGYLKESLLKLLSGHMFR